jgi:hypothetical protein
MDSFRTSAVVANFMLHLERVLSPGGDLANRRNFGPPDVLTGPHIAGRSQFQGVFIGPFCNVDELHGLVRLQDF